MVEGFVEAFELLVGKVGNVPRIAARGDAIGRIGEEGLLAVAVEQTIGRRIGALHLVVHYPLKDQGGVWLGQFVTPALLFQHLGRQAREEDRIKVHINQVVEIGHIGGRDRVDGFVRVGHGVEEGLDRTLDQFKEGFLDRVLARAAEDAVFEDMAMPVLSEGGVRKVMPKLLFSSSFSSERSWAPVLAWRYSRARVFNSAMYSSRSNSKPWVRVMDVLAFAGQEWSQ